MRQTQKSGIALVLSMIILVMMVMLAMPFVLSQNASIKSSNQFALRQECILLRENTEALGLALAANAYSVTWQDPNSKQHHAILDDVIFELFGSGGSSVGLPSYESNAFPLTINLDTQYIEENIWNNPRNKHLKRGLILTDDSGRIDMNALSASQWVDLLNIIGITYKPNELAAGFINYRYGILNGEPFRQLDQLLNAQPYNGVTTPRPKLTAVELERLRPHVTPYGMGQANNGQLELGSIFVEDPSAVPKIGIVDIHPSITLYGPQSMRLYDGKRDLSSVNQTPVPITTPISQALNINTATELALKYVGFGDLLQFTNAGKRKVFTSQGDMSDDIRKKQNPLDDINKERPPLGIKSNGVVHVTASALSRDRGNNPVANSSRTLVAMALHSKEDLKRLWNNQLDFNLMNLQRFNSLMASWPRNLERQWANLSADATDIVNAYLKPKPLPGIESMDILPNDNQNWTKLYASNVEDLNASPALDLLTDITPEGVESTIGLNYPHQMTVNSQDTTFCKPLMNNSGDPQAMQPRHFSLWLTTPGTTDFNSRWLDKTVPIFELRAPESNVGSPILVNASTAANFGHALWDGSLTDNRSMDLRHQNGSNSKQHYLSLYYDGTSGQEHFVLVVAGEAIELPGEVYGAPFFPQDNPLTDTIDERTLGGGTHPLLNPQSMSWTEHLYVYPLKPDRAYHLNVIIQNTKPGGLKVYVDNLIGRDLNRSASATITDIQIGDHVTTPYPLSLQTALPEIIQNMTTPVTTLSTQLREVARVQAQIQAQALVLPSPWDSIIPNPSAWLPDNSGGTAHGIIGINGEFIGYENWTQSNGLYTFHNCKRGKRQITDSLEDLSDSIPTEQHGGTDISSESYRRQMPGHLVNSEVWPGGVSFDINQKLYRGGSVLLHPYTGNPAQDNKVQGKAIAALSYAGTAITLDDVTQASYFPEIGFIKVRGRINADTLPPNIPDGQYDTIDEFMYYQKTGTTLQLLSRNEFGSNPSNADFITVDPLNASNTFDLDVNLVSWEVAGDPTNRYHSASTGQTESSVHTWGTPMGGDPLADPNQLRSQYDVELLQLYDVTDPSSPTYGHIEWIHYTDYAIRNGRYYFINRAGGFGGGRGAMGTHYDAARIFPTGTRLVPVQRAGTRGYLLEPGDVVTISTQQLGSSTINKRTASGLHNSASNTWQAVIRYVSSNTRDSYNSWDGSYHYNKTVRFAFTDELPELPDASKISVWPSYANQDLTLYNAVQLPSSTFNNYNLPYVNAWDASFGMSGDNRRVYIGKQNNLHLPTVNNLPGTVSNLAGRIDKIIAARPVSGTSHTTAKVLAISSGTISAGASATGTIIEVSKSNSGFSDSQRDRSGLIVMKGEVFAYITETTGSANAQLTIVGRSLLGSVANNVFVGDDVVRLPIGPVAVLNDTLTNAHLGIVDLADVSGFGNDISQLNKTHTFLFMKADGSSHEIIQLISTNGSFHTAPWLRGMYNTAIQDWDVGDIVIAWTPRYASALPKSQLHLSTPEHHSALLRSRCYAWIGAPMHVYGMVLKGTPTAPSAEVIMNRNPAEPFDFEMRALDDGHDWATTSASFMDTNSPFSGDSLDLPDVFEAEWEPKNDSYETRIHWRYRKDAIDPSDPVSTQLEQLGEFCNTAPSIKSVELRARGGVKIIDAKAAQ